MTYRTIVADPPWSYERTGITFDASHGGTFSTSGLPYSAMALEEIAALPVEPLADPQGAHLYVWTTQRYLRATYELAEGWGFTPSKVLVWCKPPTGFSMGGAYGNACEFVLFARRGSVPVTTRVPRDWWEWPRRGGHSAKPEAFLDMVEQVSPGPYLEMFARRDRLGWDTWGNESLGTAQIAA